MSSISPRAIRSLALAAVFMIAALAALSTKAVPAQASESAVVAAPAEVDPAVSMFIRSGGAAPDEAVRAD